MNKNNFAWLIGIMFLFTFTSANALVLYNDSAVYSTSNSGYTKLVTYSITNNFWLIENNTFQIYNSLAGNPTSVYAVYTYYDQSTANSSIVSTTSGSPTQNTTINPNPTKQVSKIDFWMNPSNPRTGFITNNVAYGTNDTSLIVTNVTAKTYNDAVLASQTNITFMSTDGLTITSFNKSTGFNQTTIGLTPNTYQMITTIAGYHTTTLYPTISNTSNINVYMSTVTNPVTFQVKDNAGNLVQNANINFYTFINGNSVLVVQGLTDFSGSATINLDPTLTYTLLAYATNYDNFTGTINPTQATYTIVLNSEIGSKYTSLYQSAIYTTSFNYSNGTMNATFTLISPSNSLQWFGLNTSLNGTNVLSNLTSASGGTAQIIVTGINVTNTFIGNIDYFIKVQSYPQASWTTPYVFSNLVPYNYSISNTLHELDVIPQVYRTIIGMIIIIFLIALGSKATGSMTMGSVMGLIGLGIALAMNWMPLTAGIISFIVIGTFIISDEVR